MDAEDLKSTLERLNEILPGLPARVETLAKEELSLRASVDAFLADVDVKKAEAKELLARVEVALGDLRRESGESVAVLEANADLPTLLDEPTLAFEEVLEHTVGPVRHKRQEVATGAVAHLGEHAEARRGLVGTAFTTLHAELGSGHEQMAEAAAVGAQATAQLASVVEAARVALADGVESFGGEIEAHRDAGERDLEELKKDLASLETAFVQRAERVGVVVREDAERLTADVQYRLNDLAETLMKVTERVSSALDELDDDLDEAAELGVGARKDMTPLFEEIEERITSLKHAMESVRDAAHAVGIPF